MSESKSVAKVYSLPDCKKCEVLKKYMKDKGIPFDAKWFDTEAQTEFVMMNMFGNPPVLVLADRMASAEDMFPGGELNEDVVRGVLNV
jgi:glutaredoxin